MKNLVAGVCAIVVVTTSALSQPIFDVKRSVVSDVDYITTNYGVFGQGPTGDPGVMIPRNSGKVYIFGAGLWFGAKKTIQVAGRDSVQELCVISYNPNTGSSWMTPSVMSTGEGEPAYYSEDFDKSSGAHKSVPTRPAWPLWSPQFSAVNPISPGTYLNYPTARGLQLSSKAAFQPGVSEQFFSVYNDTSLSRYEIPVATARQMGFPLGVRIEQNVLSWQSGMFKNSVVIMYTVINISQDTLRECALAHVTDPDLGAAHNDHGAYYDVNPGLRSGTIWTDNEAIGAFGTLVVSLVQGPLTNVNGYVENAEPWIFNLMVRVSTLRSWSIASDPTKSSERYTFITSEKLDADVGPLDERFLIASSPFNMRPGDTAHFAIAYSVLPYPSPATPGFASAMQTTVGGLFERYYDTKGFGGPSSVRDTDPGRNDVALRVHVINSDQAAIHFSVAHPSIVRIQFVNALGQIVRSQSVNVSTVAEQEVMVDCSELSTGSYGVVVLADGLRGVGRVNLVR